jgi:FtsZ-binding cell division protein ZapB
MLRAAAAVVVVVLTGLCLPALAQTPAAPDPARSIEQLQAEMEFLKAAANQLRTEANNLRSVVDKLNAENQALRARVEAFEAPVNAKRVEAEQREIELQSRLYARYIDAKQREYEFAADMMTVNSYNFQHQYVAAYVILALVVGIVVSALWFAHVQLMAGLAPALAQRRTTTIPSPAPTAGGETGASGPGLPAAAPEAVPISPAAPFGVTSIDASFQKVTVTSSVVGVVVLIISLAFLYIYTKEVYTIRIVDPYRPTLSNPLTPQPETTAPKEQK